MEYSRLTRLRAAVQDMQQGQYSIRFDFDTADEVTQLAQSLQELGATLEHRFSELHAMTEITRKINKGLLLDEVMNYVYDEFRPLIPYDRIGLSLIEENGATVRAVWAGSEADEMHITRGYSAPLAGSSLQTIVETGKPRILNDLEAYLTDHPNSDSTRKILAEGIQSSLTCPLIAEGKPVGFLFFSSMKKYTYTDIHKDVFLEIAGLLSTVVEKSLLYQELLELNEMKNSFLGMAAHDLRTPIGQIHGFLKLLANGRFGEVTDAQRGIYDKLMRKCEHQMDMLNDLLDISAIESGNLNLRPELVDLKPLLREQCDEYQIHADEKSIDLRLDLSPEDYPAQIEVDSRRLQQILSNLLTNAIKYSPSGSTITIRSSRNGANVVFAVEDEGPGIPEKEQSRIFQEFGRTSVQSTGGEKSTGLGLAIVKRLVEAHGGEVGFESRAGEGSTFYFTLPV